jgi:hypothetical protein
MAGKNSRLCLLRAFVLCGLFPLPEFHSYFHAKEIAVHVKEMG